MSEAEVPRILLVDDEPDILQLAEISLSVFGGFEVTAASSGEQALDLVATQSFDLIILDLMMPDLDGMETFRRIRAEHDKQVPIAFMTANASAATRQELHELGAQGVMGKPFDPVVLPEKVREILTSA